MPDSLGILTKAAMKKDRGLFGGGPAIAYPQVPGAADMAAGHQIPFTSESLTKTPNRSKDPSLVGAGQVPAAPIIEEVTAGQLNGRLRWRGFERLFCYALGFELPNGLDGSPVGIGAAGAVFNVTAATNATPIAITTSAPHGYVTGAGVRVAGVGGNTNANGDWRITVTGASTFTLDDSSGNAAFTAGGTVSERFAAKHVFEGDEDLGDQAWSGEDGRTPGFNSGDRKVRRFQVGLSKQVNDHVFYSCLIQKLALTANPQEVNIAVDLLPYNRVRGAYNSASWTLPAGTADQVLFQQLEVKVGLRAGGVAGMFLLRPNSVEFTIENNLTADDQTTESGVNHEIPIRDNFRVTRCKLEFPRYSDDLMSTLFDGDSELIAQLEFTGAVIGGSGQNRLLGIYMSSCRMENFVSNAAGPNRVPSSFELVAEKPAAGGADVFIAAGKYGAVALKKDSEVVIVWHNEDHGNYLTEY